MRRITLLILALVSCCIASATQRGVTFEKDGLIYTIASEVTIRKSNGNRAENEPEYIIQNIGEVYVSGVSVSDSVVKIPTVFSAPSTYCRKDTTVMARYFVAGIGEKAFEGARLKDLVIPFGLRFIGNEAFRDLEITNGVLIVPPVRRMKADVFDGVKAKVLFLGLEDTQTQPATPITFDKTFQNKDRLPDFYVLHSDINTPTEGLDKKMFYTVGEIVVNEWLRTSWKGVVLYTNYARCKSYRVSTLTASLNKSSFSTVTADVPTLIVLKRAKKYEKTKTDIDLLPPYEYECRNAYTHKREVYDEFAMNQTLFRGRKGGKYHYFSLDGKPITSIESLLDESGRDPFGLQVYTKEETKAKKANKEREKNLNNKVNDLKKAFGF